MWRSLTYLEQSGAIRLSLHRMQAVPFSGMLAMIKPQGIMFLARAREHSHLEIFMGVRGQAPLASTTVFFALIRKIAFTRMTGDWAKECKLEFQIARCSLLTVLLPSGGNCHRLHSRVRNAASAIGLRYSVSIRRRNCAPP